MTVRPSDTPVRRLATPEGWTLSTTWQRAQNETDNGGPVNDYERVVFLDGSAGPHRVVWYIREGHLVAECDCQSCKYRSWCAHLASLWWQWVRGRIEVWHEGAGERYRYPPVWLEIGSGRRG